MADRDIENLPKPETERSGWPWTETSPPLPERMANGEKWPRVSIVTPSYNQSAYIEETIRSLLLQGYPNLEYMLIDGGSTDGSVEIIRKYAPWLDYWVSEPDRGQSHAINKGFERASGEIVAWINSDDMYTPAALRLASEALTSLPGIAGVYSPCFRIDEGSQVIGYSDAPAFSMEALWRRNYIPQPTVFLKRTALEAAQRLNEDLHFSLDYDLWLRIGLRSEFAMIETPLASFRHTSGTKTHLNTETFFEEQIRIFDHYLTHPEEVKAYQNVILEARRDAYINFAALLMRKNDLERGEKILKEMIADSMLDADEENTQTLFKNLMHGENSAEILEILHRLGEPCRPIYKACNETYTKAQIMRSYSAERYRDSVKLTYQVIRDDPFFLIKDRGNLKRFLLSIYHSSIN
jgi:glycosyltransferase involved in cell wall biosynthesis